MPVHSQGLKLRPRFKDPQSEEYLNQSRVNQRRTPGAAARYVKTTNSAACLYPSR